MNLTEKMAVDCGVKISRPYLDRYFLPLRNNNFIIIDTRCKNANGEYDYFNDVLELVKPYLKEADIDIFQNKDVLVVFRAHGYAQCEQSSYTI